MAVSRRSAVFDVRPGEGGRLLLMGASMACLLAAHTIAETARDAMFLSKVASEWLALVYIALAALAVIGLAGNTVLVKRVGRRLALVSTLMVAAYGTTMFYVLKPGPTAAFGLYLWTGLLGTIVVVQFWMLASSYFTSSEAKRLFGIVAASGALGALLGSLVAGGALYVLSVEQLLPVAAGFYLLGGITLTQMGEPTVETPTKQPRAPTVSGPVRLRDHPYVMRLAILGVLATAGALVSDYLLKSTAAAQLTTGELPGFFARYNAVVSVLALVLQLVGASWLLRKAGVLGAITLLPAALLIGGSVAIVTAGTFLVVAMTKGADATLRHSVNRVASELLWMPVTGAVRAIRERLDSVVARVVQAVVAAALFVLSLAGLSTPLALTIILVAISGLWFVSAAGLRPSYLGQLRSVLLKPAFDAEHELDLASIEVVVEALSSVEERRVIAAIKVLQSHGRSRLIPALLLRHDSPEVLVVALEAIALPGRTDWVALTQRLLTSEHQSVRIAAIRALARTGHREAIQKGLADGDPVVRASAVFWEAHTSTADDLLAVAPIAALLEATDADSGTVRRIVIEAIRDDGDPRWKPVLRELAKSADPGLMTSLARAFERVPDVQFTPCLIAQLATRAGRSEVRAALIAIGDPALDALASALADAATPPRVRLHLPTTIAMFGTQQAADTLAKQLASERSGAVRYRLLRALARLAIHKPIKLDSATLLEELRHHLKEHFRLLGLAVALDGKTEPTARGSRPAIVAPAPDNSDSGQLLRGLLRDKVSQARDRVFLVLEALHPRDDVRSIERAFDSKDRATRAHAFEFLDTLTRAEMYVQPSMQGVREALLVAYEELPADEQVRRVRDLADPPTTPNDALGRMLRDADSLLAACAAYHTLQLGPSVLADRVREIAQEKPLLAPLGVVQLGALG